MSDIHDFLRNSPLAKWHHSVCQRTPEDVAKTARQQGLVLEPPLSVNGTKYTLLSQGEVLKTGTLGVMVWFLDKCAKDPSLRRR